MASAVWYMNGIRPPSIVNLHDLAPKDEIFDPDPIHLSTVAAPEGIRRHLLDGDFTIVRRMQDISQNCRMPFEASFLRSSKAANKKVEVLLADPGQAFISGDVLIEDLPFRQLHFAGLGPGSCFVYYEVGGRNYSSSCLAVVTYATGNTVWVGVTHQPRVHDLTKLRSLLITDRFDDRAGHGEDC